MNQNNSTQKYRDDYSVKSKSSQKSQVSSLSVGLQKRNEQLKKTQIMIKLNERFQQKYGKSNKLNQIFIEKIIKNYVDSGKITEKDLVQLEQKIAFQSGLERPYLIDYDLNKPENQNVIKGELNLVSSYLPSMKEAPPLTNSNAQLSKESKLKNKNPKIIEQKRKSWIPYDSGHQQSQSSQIPITEKQHITDQKSKETRFVTEQDVKGEGEKQFKSKKSKQNIASNNCNIKNGVTNMNTNKDECGNIVSRKESKEKGGNVIANNYFCVNGKTQDIVGGGAEQKCLMQKSRTLNLNENLRANKTGLANDINKNVSNNQKDYSNLQVRSNDYPQLKYFLKPQQFLYNDDEIADFEVNECKSDKQILALNSTDKNEWAALIKFDLEQFAQEKEEKKKRMQQRKETMRKELEKQMQENEQKKKLEKNTDNEYVRQREYILKKEEEIQSNKAKDYTYLLNQNKNQLDRQVKFKIRKQRIDDKNVKQFDEFAIKLANEQFQEQNQKKINKKKIERQFFHTAMKETEQEEKQKKQQELQEQQKEKQFSTDYGKLLEIMDDKRKIIQLQQEKRFNRLNLLQDYQQKQFYQTQQELREKEQSYDKSQKQLFKSELEEQQERKKLQLQQKKNIQQYYLEQLEWRKTKEQMDKQKDYQQADIWKKDTELFYQQEQSKEEYSKQLKWQNAQTVLNQIKQKQEKEKVQTSMNVQDLLYNQNRFKKIQEKGKGEDYGLIAKPLSVQKKEQMITEDQQVK